MPNPWKDTLFSRVPDHSPRHGRPTKKRWSRLMPRALNFFGGCRLDRLPGLSRCLGYYRRCPVDVQAGGNPDVAPDLQDRTVGCVSTTRSEGSEEPCAALIVLLLCSSGTHGFTGTTADGRLLQPARFRHRDGSHVWMIIWPSQKKIITSSKKAGACANLVRLRRCGRVTTHSAIPLIFFM